MMDKAVKQIKQTDLTGECWMIQFEGVRACEDCEAKGTEECGGKNIIRTGKNDKGLSIPL